MIVLTLGETMALLDPVEEGEPRLGMSFTLRFAGAESNFAVALARLGVDVTWVSRLGRDAFGDMIETGLALEGIDLRWLTRDDAPTGLFCKWRSGGSSRVVYRRAGSAALDLADVAAGRFDAFWELTLAPWDVAAGVVLIREAGGVVTTIEGAPDVLGGGSIVAGNPALHRWLSELLRVA